MQYRLVFGEFSGPFPLLAVPGAQLSRPSVGESTPCVFVPQRRLSGCQEASYQIRPSFGTGRERHDYEYERCGVCNIFMANEPLAGKRLVQITEKKKKIHWARFIEKIAETYARAEKIILVMDNYDTHNPGALYEAFHPEKAKSLWDRFEFVYTPKHGSWLNMAEIELNVLNGQCLRGRIDDISLVKSEVEAWQNHRNNKVARINWQFTTDKARVKLKRLYPTYDA